MTEWDINAINGLKMALAGVMTTTAIVPFIIADIVRWPELCHGSQFSDRRLRRCAQCAAT